MKYQVQKYPDGRFVCVRTSDGRSIRLKPMIDWLHIDLKSAEPYLDHEFAKKPEFTAMGCGSRATRLGLEV